MRSVVLTGLWRTARPAVDLTLRPLSSRTAGTKRPPGENVIYRPLTMFVDAPEIGSAFMAFAFPRPNQTGPDITKPAFGRIARRIGLKLRDVYGAPEAEPLPTEHVELLLRLRHKERDRGRSR